MYVVTPICAAAAVVSAVVHRRPTKEYTHRYTMMHCRLTTAGIEVAPHNHQFLVIMWVPGYRPYRCMDIFPHSSYHSLR